MRRSLVLLRASASLLLPDQTIGRRQWSLSGLAAIVICGQVAANRLTVVVVVPVQVNLGTVPRDAPPALLLEPEICLRTSQAAEAVLQASPAEL